MKVQSDSESSSSDDDVLNSATEISTDSEFDHDPIIHEAPKIFIDDTHLRKPTKVQIKQVTIGNNAANQPPKLHDIVINTNATSTALQTALTHQELEFKPLVQVDPSLLNSNRMIPLKNPRPGDYLLNKTASTEGIASKKSLELKKRYLLGGEQGIGNKIMKSGSTSILDTKLKSFHSNISECQKLLNQGGVGGGGGEISPSMRTFLDRPKLSLSDKSGGEFDGDKKISDTESKLKKDLEEKEKVFVNNKNELNKGMEYSETINTTLIQNLTNKQQNRSSTTSGINIPSPIIEIIDLVSPEKPVPIIDLTKIEIPSAMVKSNQEFINDVKMEMNDRKSFENDNDDDEIETIDLTGDSPKKPDISKDAKQAIPDIITNIDEIKADKTTSSLPIIEIKNEQIVNDCQDTLIDVPIIPWSNKNNEKVESDSLSSTSSTSSLEDIPHYILDSTTSPDTQNGIGGVVPRLEIHDSSGALMQIDSLMIIDGKYIGDPEDLPLMEIPEGMTTSSTTTTETTLIDLNKSPVDLSDAIKTIGEIDNQKQIITEEIIKTQISKELKFDTKNENKIETLKNLPLVYDKISTDVKKSKPQSLDLDRAPISTVVGLSPVTPTSIATDNDKTPTANDNHHTDSDTEQTGQLLTETELSDWAADDAVSENFVDIEFVLNSNKGTIKRNKKMKKGKLKMLPSSNEKQSTRYRQHDQITSVETPRECGGILENLAIGEIDFMDTGSEGSCAEAYAATNSALIRNRGYIEFIENTTGNNYIPNCGKHNGSEIELKKNLLPNLKLDSSYKRSNSSKEILGIDYIEQGACILNSSNNHEMELKTPVNELPPPIFAIGKSVEQSSNNQISPKLFHYQQQPLSLTDSTNEIDDDSLIMLTSQSANTNTPTTATTTNTTTTEESDALTVVTSPLDSSSPRIQENLNTTTITTTNSSTTPTESGGDLKKSHKSSTTNNKISFSRNHSNEDQQIPLITDGISGRKRSSQEDLLKQTKRKDSDEMSYEEYVRKLQQKITQISNAKDSIDVRKHKRKTSRGNESLPAVINELTKDENEIPIESKKYNVSDGKSLSIFETSKMILSPSVAITQQPHLQNHRPLVKPQNDEIHKVPEILTLSSKLEEITKERTKQKDLIHDLVMDKLQSKKQLNAEKRLIRSRNRSSVFSPGRGTANINNSILMTTSTPPTNGHYNPLSKSSSEQIQNFKENIPNKLKNSPKDNNDIVQMFNHQSIITSSRKPRPLSDNLDKVAINHHYETAVPGIVTGKLSKTESFHLQSNGIQSLTPTHLNNHKYDDIITPQPVPLSTNTEQLRADARARARLKSNHDLGLSPEEKLQILRRKYHIDLQEIINTQNNSSDDLKARQRKMITSKSVNDISGVQMQILNNSSDSKKSTSISNKNLVVDFTSDPNLLNSSTNAPVKLSRRQKDPERRKSLIQAVSNFFTKSKKENQKDTSANTSPSKEKDSKQSLDVSGNNSVFSRFRISPKSKEKSKEKDETPFEHCNLASPITKDYHHKHEFSSTPQLFNNNNKNIDDAGVLVVVAAAAAAAAGTTTPTPTPSAALQSALPNQVFLQQNDDYDDDDEYDAEPPPIPPLPINYQRSDDESYTLESKEQLKKQRALSKASRQAELKRIRIAQEIQREQEEIEVQLKEYEARGVIVEKALRGEGQNIENLETSSMGASDEKLLKELLEIWRNITQLKKHDEELGIRQQELKLEHRHAQLKDELNLRLSCSKLDKSSVDVAAEGAILNEMLEIVAKRAALRPNESGVGATVAAAASNYTNRQSTSNESEI